MGVKAGEAFGVVVSVVTEDLKVVERLVHLHLLDEAMTTTAPETFDALRQISGLENRDNCVAIHYDSCATHLKAVQDVLLDDLYVNVVCIQCMSHLFNRAGTDVYLVQSPWYTAKQRDNQEQHVENFALANRARYRAVDARNPTVSASSSARLNPAAQASNGAGLVHVGEGDTIYTGNANNFSGGLEELLSQHCTARDQWKARLGKLFKPVNTSRWRCWAMRATAHQMLELAVLCDLGGALVTAICALRDDLPMIEKILLQLTQELPSYYARAKSLPDRSIATRDFWLCYQEDLPTWFNLVRVLHLIEPSSAMMGGAFSAMNTAFGKHDTEGAAVANDLLELTVQLSFNRGCGRGGKGGGDFGSAEEML
eukprot:jgi/Undpi1/11171/HiC_scaffold_30.g13469.m1